MSRCPYERCAQEILLGIAREELADGASIEDVCGALLDADNIIGSLAYGEHPLLLGANVDECMTVAGLIGDVAADLCSGLLT